MREQNMNRIIFFVLTFFLISVSQAQQNQAENASKTQEDAGPEAIPVTEITARADDISAEVQKLRNNMTSPDNITHIEKSLPVMMDSLKRLRAQDIYKNLSDLEIRTLNSLSQEWRLYNESFSDWRNVIQTRSQKLEEIIKKLQEFMGIWQIRHPSRGVRIA